MAKRVFEWIEENRDYAFDVIRIYLGIGLFAKGIYFIAHQKELLAMIEGGNVNFMNLAIGHYIVMAHLAGGVMLAAGAFTRIAALAQVPILIGAVFVVHLGEGLFSASQNLEFAILVLFLLGMYSVAGGGRLSVDYYLKHQKPEHVPGPRKKRRMEIKKRGPLTMPRRQDTPELPF